MCWKCGKIEEMSYYSYLILCECNCMAILRQQIIEELFLEPKDIKSILSIAIKVSQNN